MVVREAYRERDTGEVRLRAYVNLDTEKLSGPYYPKKDLVPQPKILAPLYAGVRLHSGIEGEYGHWFRTSLHWIRQIPTQGHFEMRIRGHGDNDHHISEDSAILLGETVRAAVGDKRGIYRSGGAHWTFEGNVCHLSLDFSGRPDFTLETSRYGRIQDIRLRAMVRHFFRSFAINSGLDIYAELRATRDAAIDHHLAELLYKALGQSLFNATRIIGTEIPSTKGVLA